MNTQENTNLIEVDNKEWKDKFLALQRLQENPDFNLVINQGYFKDLAVNQVSMLATEYTRRSNTRGAIFEALVAISQLEDYFHTIAQLGAPSPVDTDEDETSDEYTVSSSNVL